MWIEITLTQLDSAKSSAILPIYYIGNQETPVFKLNTGVSFSITALLSNQPEPLQNHCQLLTGERALRL